MCLVFIPVMKGMGLCIKSHKFENSLPRMSEESLLKESFCKQYACHYFISEYIYKLYGFPWLFNDITWVKKNKLLLICLLSLTRSLNKAVKFVGACVLIDPT